MDGTSQQPMDSPLHSVSGISTWQMTRPLWNFWDHHVSLRTFIIAGINRGKSRGHWSCMDRNVRLSVHRNTCNWLFTFCIHIAANSTLLSMCLISSKPCYVPIAWGLLAENCLVWHCEDPMCIHVYVPRHHLSTVIAYPEIDGRVTSETLIKTQTIE